MKLLVVMLACALVAGHAWFSHEWKWPANEELLESAMRQAFAENPEFEGVEVESEYLDGRLNGALPTREIRDLASAFAEQEHVLIAGRVANEISLGPPPDQSGKLLITYENGGFLMTGKLDEFSSLSAEDDLLLLDRGAVENRVEVSNRVIPPDWSGQTSLMFEDFFAEGSRGQITLVEDSVRLTQMFDPSVTSREALLKAAEPLRRLGMEVIDDLSEEQQELIELMARFEGGVVKELKGTVPREEIKAALLADLGNQLSGDSLRVGDSGSKTDWFMEVADFLDRFGEEVPHGEVEWKGSAMRLAGRLPWSEAKTDWKVEAEKTFPEFQIEESLQRVPDLPLLVSVVGSDEGIVLEGQVPTISSRERLVNALGGLGGINSDGLRITGGVAPPSAWLDSGVDLIRSATEILGANPWVVDWDAAGKTLAVSGIVRDQDAEKRMLNAAEQALPENWSLAEDVELKSWRPMILLAQERDERIAIRGE
ncbi:MAG: hypothetical protein AAGJ31_12715, partial [Verrucomicrobiota bacterium]